MTSGAGKDWNPGIYARFRGLRLRPALDLLAQVPDLPAGDVIDLGCGSGAAAEALALRFPGRRLVGVDSSPAMLAKAGDTGRYDALVAGDAGDWSPDTPPALIFSNALLHWLPDHAALFPRLAGLLAPGGVLAVQMPRQFAAPSHALLRDTAARLFPDRFDWRDWRPPVDPPEVYVHLLRPHGAVTVWETEYIQHLGPAEQGHPVRNFTQSTAMRPIVEKLEPAEERAFLDAYDAALAEAYPTDAEGGALFPFRRLFAVLETAA